MSTTSWIKAVSVGVVIIFAVGAILIDLLFNSSEVPVAVNTKYRLQLTVQHDNAFWVEYKQYYFDTYEVRVSDDKKYKEIVMYDENKRIIGHIQTLYFFEVKENPNYGGELIGGKL